MVKVVCQKISTTTKEPRPVQAASPSDFEEDCIRIHNDYRAKHKVSPLVRSEECSRKAAQWAQTLAKEDRMYLDSKSGFGQNLFAKWSSNSNHQVTATEPIQCWYGDIANYKFGGEPARNTQNIGHFTQVVWKGSKEVGVAQARSRSGKVYVVAYYHPAGNIVGSFKDNVPPIGGHPASYKPSRSVNAREAASSQSPPFTGAQKLGSDIWRANFIRRCVDRHNVLRAKHSAPPLKLDDKLNKISQDWASHLAALNKMYHRPNNSYGENIYCIMNTGSDPLQYMEGHEPVDNWYSEIKDYDFKNQTNVNISKVGHFTQLVWKQSTKIGVGVAKSDQGKVFVVTNYDPAGNFIGQFPLNVLK